MIPHSAADGKSSGRGLFGFLELFKSPNLRKKTVITYYLWFATSLVYYGLTLNSNSDGASLFVYFSVGKGKSSFIVDVFTKCGVERCRFAKK